MNSNQGVAFGLILIAGAIALAVVGFGRERGPALPEVAKVPPAELVDETGKPFALPALAGKFWIADFVFTNCDGPCPLMTAQMRLLQDEFKDEPGLRLVTFSVDPERDTPAVLAEYARRYQAKPGFWHFLTAPPGVVHKLEYEGFKLPFDPTSPLDHSTMLVLVDSSGVIRGYYNAKDEERVEQLRADLRAFLKAAP